MTPVQRLVANGNSIIGFLKDFTTGNAQDVSIDWINDDGTIDTKTFPNIAKQFNSLDTWKENVFDRMDKTFYVDAENGDDNNIGDSNNPFKTIKKAVDSIVYIGYIDLIGSNNSFKIEEDINIKGKIITISGSNASNHKIIFTWTPKSYGLKTNYFIGDNCSLNFTSCNIEAEDLPEGKTISDVSGYTGVLNSSLGGLTLTNNTKINGKNLWRVVTLLNSGSNLNLRIIASNIENILNNKILDAYYSTVMLTTRDGKVNNSPINASNFGCITRDTNNVPRNVVSNMVL